MPDAQIYVNSIIMVRDFVKTIYPGMIDIDEYNRFLKQVCKRNKWAYIDNGALGVSCGGC